MRALALVLCLAATAAAQGVKLPATVSGEIGDFVVIKAETGDAAVKWYVVDKGLKLFPQELQNDTKKAVVIALSPGRYRILAVSATDGVPSDFAECEVVIGGVAPTPVPPPNPPQPGPVPPAPVPPAPVPTPSGPRVATIIREGHEQTPKFADLVKALRSGPTEKWLTERGHLVYVVDDDQKGPNGQPTHIVQQWRAVLTGMSLPVLVIHDPKTQNIITKMYLDKNESDAQKVVDAIVAAGG